MYQFKVIRDRAVLHKLNTALDKAQRRAGHKTAITVKAHWARRMHQTLNLPIGEIKQAMTIKPGDTPGVIRISVDSTAHAGWGVKRGSKRRSLPLAVFNPKRTRKGVTLKIKRDRGRELIRHAFIAGRANGKPTVFIRAQAGHERVQRLPIKTLYTTALEDVAQDSVPAMERFAADKLAANYARQLSYELAQQFNHA